MEHADNLMTLAKRFRFLVKKPPEILVIRTRESQGQYALLVPVVAFHS